MEPKARGLLPPIGDGSDLAPAETLYLNAAGLTVAAGTSEVQRNIIAGRGLGLPRG